jgi:hypothetical protein
MNQVLHAGAETARLGSLLGYTTVFFLVTMVGWTLWAWAPGSRLAMEAASRLPLDGGEE